MLEIGDRPLRGRREHHRGRRPRAQLSGRRHGRSIIAIVLSRWRSTTSTASTTPRTRSRPSSRPACCRRVRRSSGRRSSTSSRSSSSRRTSPNTIGKGDHRPERSSTTPCSSRALVGAIVWDLITWWYGLPVSSSHALIGGLAGAGVAQGRARRARSGGLPQDRALHRALAVARHAARLLAHDRGVLALPALAARRGSIAGSAALQLVSARSTASATAATTRRRRWASSGGADRQGHARPRSADVAALGRARRATPRWASGRCRAAGASCSTMGMRITKLKPVGGFCAETGGAITLFLATRARRSGLDDAHDHGRDRRRRRRRPALGRALGRRRPDRLGLAVHDPGGGAHRRRDLRRPARPRRLTNHWGGVGVPAGPGP